MPTSIPAKEPTEDISPLRPLLQLVLLMVAGVLGAVATLVLLPGLLPGLAASLLGTAPKAFWYLARASGFVAYLLLWLSVVFGLAVSSKLVRLWKGGPAAVDLHQFVTWLAIVVSGFHGLILLGDRFINASLGQVLVPFAYVNYRPFWVGLGQIGFYVAVLVAASFYARPRMSYRTWRTVHYASFAVYLLLTLHGALAGTDSTLLGVKLMYVLTGFSVYFLTVFRIFQAVRPARSPLDVKAQSPARPRSAR